MMTSSFARSDALAIAQECADLARRAILPHFRNPVSVHNKDDSSPVTIADKQAEAVMRGLLKNSCPDHAILGEEDGQSGTDHAEWLWVLDPIDGTRAFVTGRPSFCTLIALLHRGTPVLGLIDQPVTQERWIGIRGQKTLYSAPLFTGSDRFREISTRRIDNLQQAEFSCTAPEIIRPACRPSFENLKQACKRVTWGGDAYAYGLLSLGMIDIIAEDTLKIWDWAALVPVIEGAGGCVTDWHGASLTSRSDGTLLACGTPDLLEAARSALFASPNLPDGVLPL